MLLQGLVEAGQGHLFSGWPAPGSADDDKRRMVVQLVTLNARQEGALQ